MVEAYTNSMSLFNQVKEDVWAFIDESYDDEFCAVCMVIIQGEKNLQQTREIFRKIAIEPMVAATTSSDIYHYAEQSIAARQAITQWVSKMPISAYVNITAHNVPPEKTRRDLMAYGSLLGEIIVPIFQKFKSRLGDDVTIHMNFENLSNKTSSDQAFFNQQMNESIVASPYTVSVATKDKEPLIYLPDFFLGYIRDHIVRESNITWPATSLKLLADKVGLILHTDIDGEKSRYIRGESVATFLS